LATVRKLEQWLKTRPEEAQRINDAVAKLPQDSRADARVRMIEGAIRNEAFRNTQGVGGPKLRHRFHEVAQSCLMFHLQNHVSGTFATP